MSYNSLGFESNMSYVSQLTPETKPRKKLSFSGEGLKLIEKTVNKIFQRMFIE
jgi:hypothetical protein